MAGRDGNSNFAVELSTTLNTSGVTKQIQDLQLKLKKSSAVRITLSNGAHAIKEVNQLADAFGNLYIQEKRVTENGYLIDQSFKKVTTSIKTLETQTDKWVTSNDRLVTNIKTLDSEGNILNTRIREYVDAQGYAVKETQLYDEALRPLGNTIKERTKDQVKLAEQQKQTAIETAKLAQAERERMADVSKTTTYNKQMVDGHKALVKTIEEIDNKGQKTTTTIAQYKNELGQTVTVTNKFDEVGNKMQGTITEIDGKVRHLGASFLETIGKVAKFYVATIPIQMVQTAITEAIETVKEFDEALTEFRKVSDLSGEALDEYTQKLGELGEEVARTRTEMIEGATEFQKSGFGKIDENLPAQLAQITALYQNIADEELSVADASSVIISQMKAFGYETESDATHIIDSINKVSNEFALSSGDIGRGLTQAGAALSTYGNDFEQVVGLVSAGTEIFQGKSQQVKFMSCLLNIA